MNKSKLRSKGILKILCAAWLGLLCFPSCNTTKFLAEDEVLLSSINIEIDTVVSSVDVTKLKTELKEFHLQIPNGNTWLGVPKEWYYYKNQDTIVGDAVQEYTKKKVAEEPAILDTQKINKAGENMQNYLRNKKGFYNAVVSHDIRIKNKRAHVTYYIKPNNQYVINSLSYNVADESIKDLVVEISEDALIKVDDPIDAYTFDLEKQRIVNELQNRGFAKFNLNYIEIEGDSTDLNRAVDIFFNIRNPAEETEHRKYTIGKIEIYTDYFQFQDTENLESVEYKNKSYFRKSNKFLIKPDIIDRKIHMKSGELYKADNYYKTIRKLYGLNTYRFNKISPIISEDNPNVIDYKVFLTPHDKKYITDIGLDAFYSDVNYSARNLVGFGLNVGLEDRNTFHGSETFKLNFETGVELNLNAINTNEDVLTTFTLGISNTLDIPRLTRPLNLIPLYNKIGLISDKVVQKLDEEGTSRISVGYNYTDVLDYYRISSFNTSYGFDFVLNKNHRVKFNQIGLNYARNIALDSLKIRFSGDPLFQRSFQSTFFSGLIFRDISYGFESDESRKGIRWAFLSNFELSGLEIWAANKISNSISGSNDVWRIANNIEFSKFAKLDLDWRVYKRLNQRSQLAARFRTGIALPFGENNIISWLKLFSVGGPNSIRGWRPMQIGPGAYSAPNQSTNIFFQRGSFLMEYSLEYRFDLFWKFEGGLFFDGGNVWTLNADEEANRPGSRLSSNFVNEFALGYGYGLRMDFSYFLIRFDFGFKLKNPTRDLVTNELWLPLKGQSWYGNVNVAVDYSF